MLLLFGLVIGAGAGMKKPQRLERRTVYESEWIDLHVDRVEYPGGRIAEKHHNLHFHRAGVAALVTNDQDQLLMIRSFRYITDSVEWELPAGATDGDEPLIETARREVLEETGYQSTQHKLLYTYHPSIGISDQIFHIFTCRAGNLVGTPDPSEVQDVRWLSRAEVRQLVRDGVIRDGFTLSAILLYLMNYIENS